MNEIMYYGGFFFAGLCFVLSVLFFFVFRVPSIHKYFKRNSRKGLVQAELVTGKIKAKQSAPKHISRQEFENLTQVISLADDKKSSQDATGIIEAEMGTDQNLSETFSDASATTKL